MKKTALKKEQAAVIEEVNNLMPAIFEHIYAAEVPQRETIDLLTVALMSMIAEQTDQERLLELVSQALAFNQFVEQCDNMEVH